MIRWFWFWKLLKQLFIIWLISCFGLLANSFVNADSYVRPIWVYGFSPRDNSIDFEVIKNWSFLSMKLWSSKDLLYFSPSAYFFWAYSEYHQWVALYSYLHWRQGFLMNYAVCDEIPWVSSWDYYPTNCSRSVYNSNSVEVVGNFLKNVNQDDYFYIKYDYYRDRYHEWAVWWLCISSHQLGRSICFGDCFPNNDYYSCDVFDLWLRYNQNHTWSLDMSAQFDEINRRILTPSPAYEWQNPTWNWTVWDNVNGNIQWFSTGGNITYECTNKKALEYYNSVWLSKNLCFWWLDNYNTWNITIPTPWTWKDILDIWAETALINGETYGYEEWFSYYRNAYNNLNMVALSNPFTWKPDVLQSLFRMIDTYGASVSDRVIIEYCDLLLYKSLTWTYNWILGNEPCSVNWQNSIDYYYNYWSGYTTIIGNNVFDWTWEVITDWSVFMETFINKLKTQFVIDRSNTWLGVIPRYIISFMVLLALFRFISH